jgi:predicted RNase H-like nuclease (RuvC/YqgF family)
MSLWEDVRRNIIEWYTVAAERTEEWTRLGVHHYERFGLSRQLERRFAELGGEVHRILNEEAGGDALEADPRVQACLERISHLEEKLRAKDEEIEKMRRRGKESPGDRDPAAATHPSEERSRSASS